METKNTKKRGRPPKENTKSLSYRIRLDSEDRAMLEQLSQESGMSMSDILRKGLRIQYDTLHLSDQAYPEESRIKDAQYCDNNADFIARQVLAEITGMPIDSTIDSLTIKLIFGKRSF